MDLNDYPVKLWNEIIDLAQAIMNNPHVYEAAARGKIMATLFYEPSTRTQMSFQSAMLRLGGGIIGFDNPNTSSISKGENLKDTIKTISGYSDLVVMRHYFEGAVKAAALNSDCSVINAGDGGHLHPTQTLTDLTTLKIEKRTTSGLKIGVCGDLKNGRTAHSLVRAVSEYPDNSFTFISTSELGVPDYIKTELFKKGIRADDLTSLEDALPELDVLYMTRIQKERFSSEEEYERQNNRFILTAEKLKRAKDDLIIMHPLPRVNEISCEVDDDSRAKYFKQANYGMYARMALILILLNYEIETKPLLSGGNPENLSCPNLNCAVNRESGLAQSFVKIDGAHICEYCESEII